MEQEANKILEQFKNGTITKDKARRLLFVLSGVSKSAYCKLDRLKEECSIALHTTPKGECGTWFILCYRKITENLNL